MESAVGSVVARLGSEKVRAAVLVPTNDVVDIDWDHVGSDARVEQCPVRVVDAASRVYIVLGPSRVGRIADVFLSCVRVGAADDKHLRIPENHVGGGRVMPPWECPISLMVRKHFQPDKGGQRQDVEIVKGADICDRRWYAVTSPYIARKVVLLAIQILNL